MEKKSGIEKNYLKNKSICKVTFRLPKECATEAQSVTIAGEFNDWDPQATPMKLDGKGDFVAVVELEKEKEYRFGYCIDGEKWENDWSADRYEPNPFGSDDSVVVV